MIEGNDDNGNNNNSSNNNPYDITNIIPREVLNVIFSSMLYKDLMSAGNVCRNWNRYINSIKCRAAESHIIVAEQQDIFEDEEINGVICRMLKYYIKSVPSFVGRLHMKPALNLSFCNVNYSDPIIISIFSNDEFLWRIKNCKFFLFGSEKVTYHNRVLWGGNNEIVSLFLPDKDSVTYDYLFLSNVNVKNHVDRLENYNDFLVKTKYFKCIFVFVAYESEMINQGLGHLALIYYKDFVKKYLNTVKSKYKRASYALWGGFMSFMDTNHREFEYNHSLAFVSITVSGPSIRSYSLVVDCYLDLEATQEKVESFRHQIPCSDLNPSTQVLLSIPFEKSNEEKLMIFKNTFAPVKLICVELQNLAYAFGVNSKSKEDQKLHHKHHYVILVFSCYNF